MRRILLDMRRVSAVASFTLVLALLAPLFIAASAAASLLSDDFNSQFLDSEKWTANLEIPGGSVAQDSGCVQLVNGGTLITKSSFKEPVTIRARFQLRHVERSNLKFVLRTDGQKTGSERKGIAVQLQCRTDWNGYVGQLAIFEIGTPSPATVNFTTPLNLDQWYTVVIVDKGQSIELYFDGSTAPSIALASSFSAGQRMAIYNREGGAAGSWISEGGTAAIDYVEIDASDSDGDGLSDGWEIGGGRYQVMTGNFTWEEAKIDAELRGGHLATITSQAESDLIFSLFGSVLADGTRPIPDRWNDTWLGGSDAAVEGQWTWVTGESWGYTRWGPTEPNNGLECNALALINRSDIGHQPGITWNDDAGGSILSRYLLEFGYPTDPFDADSDEDGFNDKVESDNGSDPNNAAATPILTDHDNDGVNYYREIADGTNPTDASSLNPLSKGLVAYYPFDGNPNDASGYGKHGEVRGAQTSTDRYNTPNSCYSFDGNDWIETGHRRILDGAREATIAAWVTLNPEMGNNGGWGGQLLAVGDYRGGMDPISLRFTTTGTSQTTFQNTLLGNNLSSGIGGRNSPHYLGQLSGAWQHIAVVLSKDVPQSSFRIYINGIEKVTLLGSDDGAAFFTSISYDRDMPMLVGALEGRPWYSAPGQFWNGKIDDVRVYDRALSASEIQVLTSLDTTPTPTPSPTPTPTPAPEPTPTPPPVSGPADSDLDGVNDVREAFDGTDPVNANSFNPLSKGLVAYYPFYGTADDVSGYSNNFSSSPIYGTDRHGLETNSATFSSTNPLSSSNFVNAQHFTATFWLKLTNTPSVYGERILLNGSHNVSWNDASCASFGIAVWDSGRFAVSWLNAGRTGQEIVLPPGTIAQDKWYQVFFTADGTNVTLGLNAQAYGVETGTLASVTNPISLGGEADYYFDSGLVDDVRLYNRALTADEIAALYYSEAFTSEQKTFLVSVPSVMGHYSQNAYDASRTNGLVEGVAMVTNSPTFYGLAREYDLTNNPSAYGLITLAEHVMATTNSYVQGVADVTNNPSAFGLFTQNGYEEFGALQFSNGQASVATNPAAFSLITHSERDLAAANSYTQGVTDVTNNPSAFTLFTQNELENFGALQFSNGQASVMTNPSAFNLFTEEQFRGNRVAGQQDVIASPAAYGLRMEQEYYEHFTNGLVEGVGMVTNNPTFYGLVRESDVTNSPSAFGLIGQSEHALAVTNSYAQGVADVTNSPSAFNLFTAEQYAASYSNGVGAGVATILSNPASYNLYDSNSIMDLAMGGVMIQKQGTNATVVFQPQSTTDLATQPFTNNGTPITNTIPMPGNKGFLRVRGVGGSSPGGVGPGGGAGND